MKRKVDIIDELVQFGTFSEETIDFIIDTAKGKLLVEIDERDECGEPKAVATIARELADIFRSATGIYSEDVFKAMLDSEIDTLQKKDICAEMFKKRMREINHEMRRV